jgi:hypothetical protein
MTTTRTGTVNAVPATGALAIFSVKTLLKAAGWTVPRSSDGTTLNNSGDQLTTGASGANGLNNTSAWFVIREPGGRREYMFQRGASSLIWTIQFSELVKFTGGTATTSPTASDQATLWSAATLFDTDGTYRFHTVCDSVAIPGSNVYMFWFAAHTTGQAVCQTLFVADGMRSGTYHPSDASPLVIVCNYGTGTGVSSGGLKRNHFGQTSAVPSFASAWMAHGFGGSYTAVHLSRYGTPSVGWPPVVGGVGTYNDGTDGVVEIFVGRLISNGAPTGPKGTLASMRHTACGRGYPTTLNLAADPYVVIGTVGAAAETDATSIALPWITGVVPTL